NTGLSLTSTMYSWFFSSSIHNYILFVNWKKGIIVFATIFFQALVNSPTIIHTFTCNLFPNIKGKKKNCFFSKQWAMGNLLTREMTIMFITAFLNLLSVSNLVLPSDIAWILHKLQKQFLV
ncbi:hypothetical protein ACJX0J_039629, partial [Zea mays]